MMCVWLYIIVCLDQGFVIGVYIGDSGDGFVCVIVSGGHLCFSITEKGHMIVPD